MHHPVGDDPHLSLIAMTNQRRHHTRAFAGMAGALLLAITVLCSACGSSSDQLTGTGGTNGSGGTGGSNANCTGGNSGDQLVATTCAISGCHSSNTSVALSAGLNLTVDSGIGSRLVGVKTTGKGNSMCGGNTEPYLVAGSNPATGLLIDKLTQSTPPCGLQMPEVPGPLPQSQQQCIVEWATTLTKQ